ncbi:pro-sigmaK processing inhibitor BofA family protein [Clostridium sp.]|uniref:pro-sigmaK processing inhibitor BofA family protein n=1 Tax=Clostridium sp. TaxID=1506 RepID=UPI003F3BC404
MDFEMIIYGLVGLVLLFLVIKLLKWPLKILLNGIIGIVLLYIANFLGSYIGFSIGINAVTALIAGFLGVPGVIFLVVFKLFL